MVMNGHILRVFERIEAIKKKKTKASHDHNFITWNGMLNPKLLWEEHVAIRHGLADAARE